MRSDFTCTANATHRLVVTVFWCAGCSRWHFRQSLQQPSGPSSRRWSIVDAAEWDHTPEMDEWDWRMFVRCEGDARDLQRLYAELDSGVQRLF